MVRRMSILWKGNDMAQDEEVRGKSMAEWTKRERGRVMIEIAKSETGDTRSCDFTKVSEEQLRRASISHIGDVHCALNMFRAMLDTAALHHDLDKITALAHFHADFVTGFKTRDWWDNHRRITRHHLQDVDGVPTDVNLLDVLEMIADGVMAGMARTGSVKDFEISDETLKRAFANTVILLKAQVVVQSEGKKGGG